jgi:hypothetical protein
MHEPGGPADGHAVGEQEQAIGAMADTRIRIGPGQLLQARTVRGEIDHGVTSCTPPIVALVHNF